MTNKHNKKSVVFKDVDIENAVSDLVQLETGHTHPRPYDDLERRRTVDRVLLQHKRNWADPKVREFSSNRRLKIMSVAIVAAACFALGLWSIWDSAMFGKDGSDSKPQNASIQIPEPHPFATVIGIERDSMSLVFQSHIGYGRPLETGNAAAALALGNRTVMMLGANTQFRLERRASGADEIVLDHGEILASVVTRGGAPVLYVSTPEGQVVITGTVFGVRVNKSSVDVALYRGSVKVSKGRGDEYLLTEGHQIRLGEGEDVIIEKDRIRNALHTALELEKAASAEQQVGVSLLSWEFGSNPVSKTDQVLEPIEESNSVSGSPMVMSSKNLLHQAQQLRGKREWHGAARTYKQLISAYPNSGEAQIGLVSLGSIQLNQLNRPKAALHSFNRYLATSNSGTLNIEASWGKIKALRKLNRTSQEEAALERFIKQYPKAIQRPLAKQRLSVLMQKRQ